MRRTFPWRTFGEVLLVAELCLISASAFTRVFEAQVIQWRLLVAVLLGVLPGVLLRLRVPRPHLWLVTASGAGALLFGLTLGAFRGEAFVGVLPSPGVFAGIGRAVTDGAYLIVTSLIPAPAAGELLAVPISLVFCAALVATEVTWRTRSRLAPLGLAAGVAVLAWMFGPSGSEADLVSAAVFTGVSMLFLVSRDKAREEPSAYNTHERSAPERDASTDKTTRSSRARAAGVTVLGVAALVGGAMAVSAVVPNRADRFELRDVWTAPIQLQDQVNPLLLVGQAGLQEDDPTQPPVASVRVAGGGGESVYLPVARLDAFDCSQFLPSGGFLAASTQLPPLPNAGKATTVEVEYGAGEFATLPIPGNVTSVVLERDMPFYFEPGSRTVSLAAPALDGVNYRAETVLRPHLTKDSGADITFDASAATAIDRCGLSSRADLNHALSSAGLAGSDAPAVTQLLALAGWCRSLTLDPSRSAGEVRIEDLFKVPGQNGTTLAETGSGSAEQIATACAVLARQLGLPVRLAVGYGVQLDDKGVGTARPNNFDAWMEVRDTEGLWNPVEILPGSTVLNAPVTTTTTTPPSGNGGTAPPTTVPPTFSKPDQARTSSSPTWLFAALAVTVALGLAALVVATRGRRRRSRRQRGAPEVRMTGAWLETVDSLKEVGVAADTLAPEELRLLAVVDLPEAQDPLDHLASCFTSVFARTGVTTETADAAWLAVHQLRSDLAQRRRSEGTERMQLLLSALRGRPRPAEPSWPVSRNPDAEPTAPREHEGLPR